MKTVTIDAETAEEAKIQCVEVYGWYPDTVREVDSGVERLRAWKCFESKADAEIWDHQL